MMMPRTTDPKIRNATAWLNQLSQAFDNDHDLIDVMPIEDVHQGLRDLGADIDGFHTKLHVTLSRARLSQRIDSLITWVSPVWQPQWAGQFVGAGDIAVQKQTFLIEETGKIEMTCSWKPGFKEGTPAYMEVAWNADTVLDGEFWCRFVKPETETVLAELSLGTYKEGGKYFTCDILGFDPSHEPWALSILLKQHTT